MKTITLMITLTEDQFHLIQVDANKTDRSVLQALTDLNGDHIRHVIDWSQTTVESNGIKISGNIV